MILSQDRNRSKNAIYISGGWCYDTDNLILQTVEAEITAMMPLQRVRVAENRMRYKLSNGPQRAQSNVAGRDDR